MTSSSFSANAEDARSARKTSDFSIEHILNAAGNSERPEYATGASGPAYSFVTFPWLHCTRYYPPRIPRTQKRETPQKRQLGRHPRIPFTSHQLAVLEERFKQSPYLSSQEVTQLSRSLQLADVRVKIWFQNRRARERRERTPVPLIESPEKPLEGAVLVSTVKDVRSAKSTSNDAQLLNPAVPEIKFRTSSTNFRPAIESTQHHLSDKAPRVDNHCFWTTDSSKKIVSFK